MGKRFIQIIVIASESKEVDEDFEQGLLKDPEFEIYSGEPVEFDTENPDSKENFSMMCNFLTEKILKEDGEK